MAAASALRAVDELRRSALVFETEFAEALARATGHERVRLTTAGTLATMYAMMLCRAYNGRDLVVKVAGGWHGANPLALKGIDRAADGFDRVESAGVSASTGVPPKLASRSEHCAPPSSPSARDHASLKRGVGSLYSSSRNLPL